MVNRKKNICGKFIIQSVCSLEIRTYYLWAPVCLTNSSPTLLRKHISVKVDVLKSARVVKIKLSPHQLQRP